MAKTISFRDSVSDVSASDRDNVLAAADGWHDPPSGQVVSYVSYDFEDRLLSVAVRIEDVDVDSVQTTRDTLAAAIDNLPLDFGSLAEIKEAIDIQ